MHDWAEVHRLHHVEGLSKQAIAAKLGMSRTTVDRLLGLAEPPRYQRVPAGSKLDPFRDAVAAMLREDPRVPATVIRKRLRPHGFCGVVDDPQGPSAPGPPGPGDRVADDHAQRVQAVVGLGGCCRHAPTLP